MPDGKEDRNHHARERDRCELRHPIPIVVGEAPGPGGG